MSEFEKPNVVGCDGSVHFPAFDLPLSIYMSEEAKQAFTRFRTSAPPYDLSSNAAYRSTTNKYFWTPLLKEAERRYSVSYEQKIIADVRVDIVTPDKVVDEECILINLHGGSYEVGNGGLGGLVEAVPIAAVSGLRVISVDYRQSPEHRFPAASEDVVAVYTELLRSFRPNNIGIYGCSAGAILTSGVVASLIKQELPVPAAIGLFCAGADPRYGGDSRYITSIECGDTPTCKESPPELLPGYADYFKDASTADALVTPALSPAVLEKFPPTLLISGTRAYDLSSVAYTHIRLVKLGVDANLYVWDGMWHGFHYDASLPESREAFEIIGKFFRKNMM